jgi:hypothetical protein
LRYPAATGVVGPVTDPRSLREAAFLGVDVERKPLETVARPLSADDGDVA